LPKKRGRHEPLRAPITDVPAVIPAPKRRTVGAAWKEQVASLGRLAAENFGLLVGVAIIVAVEYGIRRISGYSDTDFRATVKAVVHIVEAIDFTTLILPRFVAAAVYAGKAYHRIKRAWRTGR
jgi:hypothetical protein